MATAPTIPFVPVDEYLNSSWRPDKEYVNGVLVERSTPKWPHGLLQRILLVWFAQYDGALNLVTVGEVRTRIGETACYRIPDVQICHRAVLMEEQANAVPVAVIEILSPDDKLSEILERFRDFASIGTGHIILMDPELYRAYKFESGSLFETVFDGLTLESGQSVLPFDSNALFDQLRSFVQSK